MLEVTVWGAFVAGLLSFISPCILPIVPPYLAWLAGVSFDELKGADTGATRRRIFFSALAFVLGFATVFMFLGAAATSVGRVIANYFDILSVLAGIVIIIMGLHFLGLFRIGLLYRQARVEVARKPAGLVGAFVVGLAFAFGWTPCVGPVLAAVLFVAGSEQTALRGLTLLAAYSAGIGIPFLLAAAFAGQFLDFASKFRRHMATVEKLMGGLLVITGILFATRQMATISYWLLETFPVFQTIG